MSVPHGMLNEKQEIGSLYFFLKKKGFLAGFVVVVVAAAARFGQSVRFGLSCCWLPTGTLLVVAVGGCSLMLGTGSRDRDETLEFPFTLHLRLRGRFQRRQYT